MCSLQICVHVWEGRCVGVGRRTVRWAHAATTPTARATAAITQSINGMLRSVMHLVKLRPLRFDADTPPPPGHEGYGPFLTDDGVVLGLGEEEFLQRMAGRLEAEQARQGRQ